MNYKESSEILKEIKKAKKILINCHRSPDPDSVGSALAMRKVLADMDKSVEVVCPDNIPPIFFWVPVSLPKIPGKPNRKSSP